MRSKRGSHVGMILSFVIFITFLIFIYTTLQPTIKTGREKQVILDHIKKDIISDITGNLTTVNIEILQDSPESSCFNFKDIVEVSDLDNTIVKNSQGDIVNSNKKTDSIDASWNGEGNQFFKIIYSEQDFIETSEPASSCYQLETCSETTKCKINSVRQDEQILATKIGEVLGDYEGKHEILRERFNIPADSDFAIIAYVGDSSFGAEPINSQVNIFSDEVVFQYINSTADTSTGKMRISVW